MYLREIHSIQNDIDNLSNVSVDENNNPERKIKQKEKYFIHIYMIGPLLLYLGMTIMNFYYIFTNKNIKLGTNLTISDKIFININFFDWTIVNSSIILFFVIYKLINYIFTDIYRNEICIDYNLSELIITFQIIILIGIIAWNILGFIMYFDNDISEKKFINILWGNFISGRKTI